MISIREKNKCWEVWTDVSTDEFNGRCIGSNPIRRIALRAAIEELREELLTLYELTDRADKEWLQTT